MIKIFNYIFLIINFNIIACGMRRYEDPLCILSKIDGATPNIQVEGKKSMKEYNCGVMGIGIVQKIPYHENFDPIHVAISSVCVKCAMCLVIADKINKTLMTLHDSPSFDRRWLDNSEVQAVLERLCHKAFSGYRLRAINGERYIGESLPNSKIIQSTADDLWEKNLQEQCQGIMSAVGEKKVYKYWKEAYRGHNTELAKILCHGKIGIIRDCRGIDTDN